MPDVPQSVQNEIQREKLLAHEAIHARHAQGKELGLEHGGDDDDVWSQGEEEGEGI